MTVSVYVITNAINGMQYVGATTRSLYKRLKAHKQTIGRKYSCRALTTAMKEHGSVNFKIALIARFETTEEAYTGTFTVHQHLEKRCPHCLSGWIRNRYNTRWDCRNCKGWFDKPVTALLCVAA